VENQTMPGTGTQSPVGLAILYALGQRGRHVYGGTVSAATVARRRDRNRVARASRRINRKRG
jgi:hypothetical protein